jgi:3-deoxy-D-manno-octulosonic-acid transferase
MAHESRPQLNSPGPLDWRKAVWDGVLILLSPLLLVYLLVRLARGKSLAGLAQRFGWLPAAVRELGGNSEPVIWIHAVSAGEVAAVEPLVRELRQAEPTARLVLSTITATGHHMAETRRVEVDALIYFPLDFPGITESVLRRVRPRLIVLVETELWPNLLAAARQYGVKVALVNGRLSDKSFPKYRLFRFLTGWILGNVDLICAQSETDAERFTALGAAPERVQVAGNSKFDENFPQVPPEETAKWRQDLGFGQEQPVFMAASTHPREEELVLRCYEKLRGTYPELGLLIAPRHPERGDAVEALIGEYGYACRRRSRLKDAPEGEAAEPAEGRADARVQVALLDTIGEMARVFPVATVVFMGGSLVPVGGHNFLQPMACDKPVVFGPNMQNSRDLTEMALREGAALQVADGEALCATVLRLLGSEAERHLLAVKGAALLDRNTGAARAMVERLGELLEQP